MLSKKHGVVLLVILTAGIFAGSRLFAMDIYIAPLLYSDDKVQDTSVLLEKSKWATDFLIDDIKKLPVGGEVKFRGLSPENMNPPGNLLEALRIIENRKLEYLIYGNVSIVGTACYAELRLVAAESKRVIQMFYASDTSDRLDRCMRDCAEKIVSYFRDTLGYRPLEESIPPLLNGWIFSGNAGYMMPYIAPWTDYLYGIATVNFDAVLLPTYPTFVMLGGDAGVGMQFGLLYALARNKEQYEYSFLHWIRLSAGAELIWTQFRNVEFTLAAGLQYSLAILLVSPNYADPLTLVSAVPGAYASIGVSYAFAGHSSIGFGVILDLNLNKPVSGFFYPVLRYSYSLESLHEK